MAIEDIRDIKGPVYFPVNRILLTLLIIIAVSLLTYIIMILVKKYIKNRSKKQEVPPKKAHEIAYEALEALKAKDLPKQGRAKEYYFELSNIVRYYLENQFLIRAPEMTTEEFLYYLGNSGDLREEHKTLLRQFLNHCDLVKFAKYGPTNKEIDDSFSAAKKLVDETKEEKVSY